MGFDIQIEVAAVPRDELMAQGTGEASRVVRERVLVARERQLARQGKFNFELGPREIEQVCRLDVTADGLLRQAITRLDLSARAYHRVLKLARSVADMSRTP